MLAITALLTLAPLPALLSAPPYQEIGLASERTRLRFTLAHTEASDGGDLELLGAHYDWLEPFDGYPGVYLGIGGFGAFAGDQGGFLSGGLTAGYRKEIQNRLSLDAGLFAGAAAGSIRAHEGLAWRPHVAFERAYGVLGLRLELAFLEVQDTDLGGLELALGLTTASEILVGRGGERLEPLPPEGQVPRRVRATPRYVYLDLADGVRHHDGSPLGKDLDLLGLAADTYFGERLFVAFEGYGAVRGDADGFRTVLAGPGLTYPLLSRRLELEARVLAGAAGGGSVDVGDGFLWHARGGLRFYVTPRLALELMAGHIDSPDGSFEGTTYSAGISLSGNTVGLALSQPRSDLASQGLSDSDTELVLTKVSLLHKTYVPASESRREDGGEYEKTVHLVGVGLEHPLRWNLAATARVYGAWGGELGGYGEGLLGLCWGMPFPQDERQSITVSAEAGAGGGGGADVESGLIFHFSGGYRFDFSERIYLQAEVGKVEANHGSFAAESYQIGLGWKLNRPYLRD